MAQLPSKDDFRQNLGLRGVVLCVMGPDKMMINLELYSSQRKVPPGGFFCLWWGGGGGGGCEILNLTISLGSYPLIIKIICNVSLINCCFLNSNLDCLPFQTLRQRGLRM